MGYNRKDPVILTRKYRQNSEKKDVENPMNSTAIYYKVHEMSYSV
jgi:hypothetical protein